MPDLAYQKKIVEEVRSFAESEIYPHAAEFDEKGAIPRELIEKMADKGYLAASFPMDCGGLGLDPEHYGYVTEEIGKACCSTRALLTVHTSLVGMTLLKWGTPAQKREWLPAMVSGEKIAAFALSEPQVGSDAKGVQTKFYQNGDNYILNGRKKWITYGDLADIFLVFASNDTGVTAFLVERSYKGVSSRPIKGLLASRAAHVGEIDFNDVRVPAGNIVGKINNGFNYIAATGLDHGRYSIAWGSLAIARAALEAMVSYSRKRTQFGKQICGFQLIQGMIGDAVTKVHAARALCLKVADMRKLKDPDAVMETTIAKYFTSKVAMEVAMDAVQIHGGNGCCNSYPAERLFREAKVMEIIEGTSQIQQGIISKFGLNQYFDRESDD